MCFYSAGSTNGTKFGIHQNDFWLGIYICLSQLIQTLKKNKIPTKRGIRTEAWFSNSDGNKRLFLLIDDKIYDSFENQILTPKVNYCSYEFTSRNNTEITLNELNQLRSWFNIKKNEQGFIVCISNYPNYIDTELKEYWIYVDTMEDYIELTQGVGSFQQELTKQFDLDEECVIKLLPDVRQNCLFHVSCSIDLLDGLIRKGLNSKFTTEQLKQFRERQIESTSFRPKFEIIDSINNTNVAVYDD